MRMDSAQVGRKLAGDPVSPELSRQIKELASRARYRVVLQQCGWLPWPVLPENKVQRWAAKFKKLIFRRS